MKEYLNEIYWRLRRWMSSGHAPPYKLQIAPTYRCNLRCQFCAWPWLNRGKSELSSRMYMKIIGEAKELGINFVNIDGGGEPFVRKDTTMAIIKKVKNLDMKGGITTNGTLLTSKIIKEIVLLEWDEITFSIDAPFSRLHDMLRGKKGTFNILIKNIEELNFFKRKFKKEYPILIINCVLTRKNFTLISEMIKLVKKLECTHVNFIPMLVHRKEAQILKLKERNIPTLFYEIRKGIEISKELNISSNLNSLLKDKNLILKTNRMHEVIKEDVPLQKSEKIKFTQIPCFHPWLSLIIHPTGHIDVCNHNTFQSHLNGRSLEEVWYYDEHLNNLRNCFISGRIPSFCSNCCPPDVVEIRKLRNVLKNKLNRKI